MISILFIIFSNNEKVESKILVSILIGVVNIETIVANTSFKHKEKLLAVNSITLPGLPLIIPAKGIIPG